MKKSDSTKEKKAKPKNAKPLIANPTRASQTVSDTEYPDDVAGEVPVPKQSPEDARKIRAWLRSKHEQMISFQPNDAHTVLTPAQRPYFRGSSLPVCPLRTALDTVRKVPREEVRHLLMDFYTGTGHVMHEMLQFWFGKDGSLFGKFQCPECAKLYPKKAKPHDNLGMFGPVVCRGTASKRHRPRYCSYIEFHINNIPKTGAFDGHCDGVLFIGGKYAVLEIKTTDTLKVNMRGKHGPDPKHLCQATAYRYLLPKFLDIPDKKWHNYSIIIYYDRAMPRKHEILIEPYDPNLFVAEIETFVKTRRLLERGKYSKICGKCKSADDDKYCPYNSTCFSAHAQRLIEEILPGYRHDSWAPFAKTFEKPKAKAAKRERSGSESVNNKKKPERSDISRFTKVRTATTTKSKTRPKHKNTFTI